MNTNNDGARRAPLDGPDAHQLGPHPLAGVAPADFPRAELGPEAVARWYLNRGVQVFPVCAPRGADSCTGAGLDTHAGDHKRGKLPTKRWGGASRAAMTEAEVINAWRRHGHNVAMPCGRAGGSYTVAMDFDGPEGERTREDAEAVLGALPPTLTSATGRGRHLLYSAPLDATDDDVASVKGSIASVRLDAPRRVLVTARAGEASAFDLRCEGGYVVAPGSTHANGAHYTATGAPIAPLPRAWWDALPRKGGPGPKRANPPPLARDEREAFGRLDALTSSAPSPERARRYLDATLPKLCNDIAAAPDGAQNNTINANALRAFRLALAAGVGLDAVADELLAASVRGRHPEAAARATIGSAREAAEREGPATIPDRPLPDRRAPGARGRRADDAPAHQEEAAGQGEGAPPGIMLRTAVHEVEDEAVAALAGCELFQRLPAGLVEVVEAPELAPDATPRARMLAPDPGLPILQPVTAPRLRSILSARATFTRRDERRGAWVPAAPPRDIVDGVLARKVYPTTAVRPLRGIIEAPTLRPDGSILAAPGYDPSTGLLLRWRGPAVDVPERPTLDDARGAFGRLAGLFRDVVFVGDEHRRARGLAATVAAILTPIARPSIAGPVPGFLWTADRENAGKSLTAKVCGAIVTGRAPSARPYPTGEGEWPKVCAELAVDAPPVALFDDVAHRIGGGDLDAWLTATDGYAARLMRQNASTAGLRAATCLYFTANGAEVTKSTAGRLVFVELFGRGRGEHTHGGDGAREYTFPDLIGHAKAHRAEYLRDALTILRAHQLAGSPRPVGARRRDSFEAWSERIAWPLLWCAGASPVEAHAPEGADVEGEAARAAVIAWRGAFGTDGQVITAAELREQLLAADPSKPGGASPAIARSRVQLRNLLAELCDVPDLTRANARAIGKRLAARITGLRVEAPDGVALMVTARKNRNDVMEYSLTRAAAPVEAGEGTAGFAGYAGDDSLYPYGNCHPSEGSNGGGGNDGARHSGGVQGECTPANPANPAVESWEA